MNTLDSKRNSSLDILRILACFLVIVNHSHQSLFNKYYLSFTGQLSIFTFFASKCAVGIFFMISGALLLKKDINIKSNLKHRVLRIFIAFLLFSLYQFMDLNSTGYNLLKIDYVKFFKTIINKPIITPYWYLYIYLVILILLPLLAKLARNMTDEDFKYMGGVGFVACGLIPFACKLINVQMYSWIKFEVLFSGIWYAFMGHYIFNICDKKVFNKKNSYIAMSGIAVMLVFSMIFTYFVYASKGKVVLYLDGMNTFTNMIIAISIFWLGVYYFNNKSLNPKLAETLKFISGTTFGVYLIHINVIKKIKFIYSFTLGYMNPFIAVCFLQLLTFMISVVIVGALKKIPYIKNIL